MNSETSRLSFPLHGHLRIGSVPCFALMIGVVSVVVLFTILFSTANDSKAFELTILSGDDRPSAMVMFVISKKNHPVMCFLLLLGSFGVREHCRVMTPLSFRMQHRHPVAFDRAPTAQSNLRERPLFGPFQIVSINFEQFVDRYHWFRLWLCNQLIDNTSLRQTCLDGFASFLPNSWHTIETTVFGGAKQFGQRFDMQVIIDPMR
ncbi:hypothetical protein-transmembrane region and signal peptide prediction [Rhodopirellula baltica SH 1]|uniref:Uncharacterized protein n=1 Tax=Rhodopirellula baltica (strain DSM 10527 / NCIMB 13988 / SH1) TaxID=243090 RepID=Q7UHA7_RHOBA|nr:hypothetical protein-transmembrane region and signal peptide prediction [Rhodopirellula baltica SH 1]